MINIQTALIVRRTWKCLNTQALFLLFPQRDAKTVWIPKFQLVALCRLWVGLWGHRQWCLWVTPSVGHMPWTHSCNTDPTTKDKSVLSFPSWDFSGCALKAWSGRKSLCVRAQVVGQTLGPGGCQKSGINEHWRIQALSWCFVCQSVTGWVHWAGKGIWTPAFLWKCTKRARSSLKRVLCGHEGTWLLRSNKIWGTLASTEGVGGRPC